MGTLTVARSFTVVVEPDTLVQSGRGGISGRIHVAVGRLRFPERKWSDLVVATLLGWLEVLLGCGESGTGSLRFMDGPFLLECEARPDRETVVRCVSSVRRREVLHESEVEHREIVAAVVDAARQVLSECARLGWKSADLQRTRELVATFEARLLGARRPRDREA